jgi:hypothetical protein
MDGSLYASMIVMAIASTIGLPLAAAVQLCKRSIINRVISESRPVHGDGSTSNVRGLTLTDRDRALIIIAQEICGYLQTHREGDLEQIETRMSAYLATVGQCAGKDQA